MKKIDVNQIKVGDIFSEESHYKVTAKLSNSIHFST